MLNINQETKFNPRIKTYLLAHLVFFIFLLSLTIPMAGLFHWLRNFLLLLVSLGLLGYAFIVLVYNHWSYIVTGNNIIVKDGIIFRKSKTINFKAIQNVTQKQGPLMLIFGIKRLEIWTASQSQLKTSSNNMTASSDASVILNKIEADELQSYIIKNNAL